MSFTVASLVLQCICACFCPRLGCCDPTKTDWWSKSRKFRPWLGQGPCDFIGNSSRCPTKLNWKRRHCFNGKFFVKVIKGLLNDFGARMGPVRLFFVPIFGKNWGLFRQKSIQFHLSDQWHLEDMIICIRVPGIQRCRRRWVVFSWISRRTEPWVQDWIFFGCPKMDDVQRTFCEIFPHFLFFRMIVWRAEMNVYVVLIS